MLTLIDEFAGAGGSTQGAAMVPGVQPILALNHWATAVQTHAANWPGVEHRCADIQALPVESLPRADLFWASPACPAWSNARGQRRDFDRSTQHMLPGFAEHIDPALNRSRALMEEVPRYLRAVNRRGKPVLAGVVENVTEVRHWDQFGRWLREIHAEGYHTKVIALNSMHAHAPLTPDAPQDRTRAFIAYWHVSLGRSPDWDKWLRPLAWCPTCEQDIRAMQVFKDPTRDMGRYRSQYTYRCPAHTCRGQIVEPYASPASTAIDWTLPAQRIGDRAKPLAAKTLDRIRAGLLTHARPIPPAAPVLLVPAGGTWRQDPTPIHQPFPTRTTRENDAVLIPAVLVPVEGRDGKHAQPLTVPARTQTARNETAIAIAPGAFLTTLRGGGEQNRAHRIDKPLTAVTASGNHHGLVIPYHRTGKAHPTSRPLGTVTTRDRAALLTHHHETTTDLDIDQCRFRMLTPAEISNAMAFTPGYQILGTKRDQVRQLGNAVTPPVAELLISALVETITGQPLEPAHT